VAALLIIVAIGVGRSVFGTGTVHVIARGPVELTADGRRITLEALSDWHWRASLPTGRQKLVLRAGGETHEFELVASGHAVHLLPLREQCFLWTVYAPGSSRPQVVKRFAAPSPAIEIPEGTLFGAELDGASVPPPAVFGVVDCAELATATDAQLLEPAPSVSLLCSEGAYEPGCAPDSVALVVGAARASWVALVLVHPEGTQVLVSGADGKRDADEVHRIERRAADGGLAPLTGATLVVLFSDAPISEGGALAKVSGGQGGGNGRPVERRDFAL
jgi:hypothetical protein